jgi:peptidyl-prolyl cis-trans isomerase SurA
VLSGLGKYNTDMRNSYFTLSVLFGFALIINANTVSLASPRKESASQGAPIFLDAVIATVNERPITLRDLEKRLRSPRRLTLQEAASDPESQAILDRMIFEQALLLESEAKKIGVEEEDIDRYLEEVAKRNNLDRVGLEKALAAEGRDLASYRSQIKFDILQSRLGATYLQNSGAVTQEEIDGYISEHPELSRSDTQVQLSRIVVSTSTRSTAEATQLLEKIRDKIDSGADFGEAARNYSDGPEAKESGSFGLIAERDLSSDIFDAIKDLDPGEVSEITPHESGLQIFRLESRITDSDSDREKIIEEVKHRLQMQKQQRKLQDFFTAELFKNHTVEKKI